MDCIELFAGIGLFRLGVEQAGYRTVMANEIDARKCAVYRANFGDDDTLIEGDIRDVDRLPAGAGLLTASFPCQDVSIIKGAGTTSDGIDGPRSGLISEVWRLLKGSAADRPEVVILENVPALLHAVGGKQPDHRRVAADLTGCGYNVDTLLLCASTWTPQRRKRVFVVGRRTDAGPLPLLTPPDPRTWGLDPLATVVEQPEAWQPLDWWTSRLASGFYVADDWNSIVAAARLQPGPRRMLLHQSTHHANPAPPPAWTRELIRQRNIPTITTSYSGPQCRAHRFVIGLTADGEPHGCRPMTLLEVARAQGIPDTWDWAAMSDTRSRQAIGDGVCVPKIAWLADQLAR